MTLFDGDVNLIEVSCTVVLRCVIDRYVINQGFMIVSLQYEAPARCVLIEALRLC